MYGVNHLALWINKNPTTWVRACALRAGFPTWPMKAVPHDGVLTFIGLYAMPPNCLGGLGTHSVVLIMYNKFFTISIMRQTKPSHPTGHPAANFEGEYLRQILGKLHQNISDLDAKKPIEIIATFYFQNVEDLAGNEANGIKLAFEFLKGNKHIQNYSLETRSE